MKMGNGDFQRMIERGLEGGVQFVVTRVSAPLTGRGNRHGGHNVVVQHLAALQRDNLARYDEGWHLSMHASE